MANRRNSIKKIRADKKKRTQNRINMSELRTLSKKFFSACESKDAENAQNLGKSLFSKLDKAAKRGFLKENTVNRRKSKASRTLSSIQA